VNPLRITAAARQRPLNLALANLSPGARLGLAALAGVLNGIGFVFWGPMALVANLPLLAALYGVRTRKLAALAGLFTGVLGGLHIYGIVDYGWFLMAGFAFYTGSQMVLFALVLRALWGRLSPWVDVALPALIWALSEHLRTMGPLAMPASYVGCIADTTALRPWLWLAPFTGGLGVSTLVALVPSVLFHGIFAGGPHRRAAAGWAVVLGAAGVLGVSLPPDLGSRPVHVAAVQGGLPNSQYAAALVDPLAQADITDTFAALSSEAYNSAADLVIWPETALRVPVLGDAILRARLFPGVADHAWLIAGLMHRENGNAYNLSLAVAPGVEGGREAGRYVKVRTVPKSEAWLTRGAAYTPLVTPAGVVGPVICLESVYPDSARAQVLSGAELLVVQSNDAGFGRSPITAHMTNRATVRAVENGRWLVRVGQAGITTLIDPRGQRHGQLGLFVPGVLHGTAQLRDDLTPFARWGHWWAWLCLAAVLAVSALSGRRRRPGRAGPGAP
jgi:apolipoprotein N-acyltransferase